jgi:hypothetical protein
VVYECNCFVLEQNKDVEMGKEVKSIRKGLSDEYVQFTIFFFVNCKYVRVGFKSGWKYER